MLVYGKCELISFFVKAPNRYTSRWMDYPLFNVLSIVDSIGGGFSVCSMFLLIFHT